MVAELRFFESAHHSLAALEGEPGLGEDVKRINAALDQLELDPGDSWARRHRFQNGLWAIVVRGTHINYVILWELHPDDSSVVLLHYVGPEPSGPLP